jgi:hypothetical protein
MRRIFLLLAIGGLAALGHGAAARAEGRDITRQPDGILDVEQNSEWTGLGVGNFDGNQADDLVFERTNVNRGGGVVTGERVFDVVFGPFDVRAKGTTPGNRYRPEPGMTVTMATDQSSPLTVADVNADGMDDFVLTQVDGNSAVERVRLAIIFGRERGSFPTRAWWASPTSPATASTTSSPRAASRSTAWPSRCR